MRSRIGIVAALLGAAFGNATFAQQASLTSLGWHIGSSVRSSPAYDVSEDGNYVVGYYHGPGSYHGPFRWTRGVGFEPLGQPQIAGGGEGQGITPDGKTVVGGYWFRPFRWTESGGFVQLSTTEGVCTDVSADGNVASGQSFEGSDAAAFRWTNGAGFLPLGTFDDTGSSFAYGISPEGTHIVGKSMTTEGVYRAFRWSEATGLEDLGPDDGSESSADAVSPGGKFVVGDFVSGTRERPFLWSEATGMVALPIDATYSGLQDSSADDVSDDGNVVVGCDNDQRGASVCLWIDGERHNLEALLFTKYGVANPGFYVLDQAFGCSADGMTITGSGHFNSWRIGYVATLPPLPTISAELPVDGVVEVSVGQTLRLPFTAVDPGGEALTLNAAGLPPGAMLTPTTGVPLSGSVEGTLTWANGVPAGTTYDVHLYVRDLEGRRASLRFKIVTIPNRVPEVDAPLPVTIECTGESNVVELQTVVDDADGDDLTVTWYVDGQAEKSETLALGSLASFEFDYPHGGHVTRVQVSDGKASAQAETSVTVQDTTAPIVIVVPSAPLSVDPGELFASKSRLVAPFVEDVCDEAPAIVNDAPDALPLGKTTVVWTVTDADGNVATARQRVSVVNGRPIADAGDDVFKRSRKPRTRVRLDGSKSHDPDAHAIQYRWSAPGVRFADPTAARPIGDFPLGPTHVTLTVTDAAGGRSTAKVRVVIKQSEATRAHSASVRRSSAEALDGARRSVANAPNAIGTNAAVQSLEAAQTLDRLADAALRDSANDLSDYGLYRAAQSQLSYAAAALLRQAYEESGDSDALSAAVAAYASSLYATADLAE